MIDCMFTRWSPGIGDPTVLGWATFLAYGIAALACIGAGRRGDRVFWLLAALLLALMVNKQLDAHVGLTALGRCMAQSQGWFDYRRLVQGTVAIGMLALSLAAGVMVLRRLWPYRLALAGFACLLGLVALRVARVMHLDDAIGIDLRPAAGIAALELVGIGLVAIAALRHAGR